jgi:hypothetical protein
MSAICVRPAPQAHGLPSTLQVIDAFYSGPSLLHGSPLRLPMSLRLSSHDCLQLIGSGSESSPLCLFWRQLRYDVAKGAGGLPRSGNRPTLKLLGDNQNVRLTLQRQSGRGPSRSRGEADPLRPSTFGSLDDRAFTV